MELAILLLAALGGGGWWLLRRRKTLAALGPASALTVTPRLLGELTWRARKAPTLGRPLHFSYRLQGRQAAGRLTASYQGRQADGRIYGEGELFLDLEQNQLQGRTQLSQGGTRFLALALRGQRHGAGFSLAFGLRRSARPPDLDVSLQPELRWQAQTRVIGDACLARQGELHRHLEGDQLHITGTVTDQREWGEVAVDVRLPADDEADLAQLAILLACSEICRANQ